MISRALNSFSFHRDRDERSASHCGCAWQTEALSDSQGRLLSRETRLQQHSHEGEKKREELRSSERSDVFPPPFFPLIHCGSCSLEILNTLSRAYSGVWTSSYFLSCLEMHWQIEHSSCLLVQCAKKKRKKRKHPLVDVSSETLSLQGFASHNN